MFSKILVAIDSSAASRRAFVGALKIAKGLNAELILVHALDVFDPASPEHPIIPTDSYSMALDSLIRETYEKQWAEFADHFEALLKQKQEEAEALALTAQYLQPYGRPGPAICKAAKTLKADLIVVGSHGYKGLQEMILGSVSNYIMHHAPCSVTVIHPRDIVDPLENSLRSSVIPAFYSTLKANDYEKIKM